MSKQSIQQFSQTAGSNTDIAGINVNIGWPPANVGSAFRTLMSFLADSFIPQSAVMVGTTLTLSAAQATAETLFLTGTPGGTCTVTLPANAMGGYIGNQATDGSSAVLTTGSGTTVTVPALTGVFYECDGTNVTVLPQMILNIPRATPGSTAPLRADQAWQEIATYTPSSAASQAIPLTSGFRKYRLHLIAVSVSTNAATLLAQFSTNGGVSYISTNTYGQFGYRLSGTTVGGFSQSATSALLAVSLSNAASNSLRGTFDILVGSATQVASCDGFSSGNDSTAAGYQGQLSNQLVAGAAINQILVFPSAGTFSGTLILEGLP